MKISKETLYLKSLTENKMPATNSGLLQWLLPDFPTENPLLNGMFCYICNGLVLVATPLRASRRTLHTIYFPNCRRTLRSYFFARKLMKFINEKSCVIMETETKLCVKPSKTIHGFQQFKDNFQPNTVRKIENRTKLCG